MPPTKQPPLRLSEFTDPDLVYQQLQGHGKQGVLSARATHEGVEVSGTIPHHSLPPRALLQETMLSSLANHKNNINNNNNLQNNATASQSNFFEDELRDIASGDTYRDNIFLQSLQKQEEELLLDEQQHLNQTPSSSSNNNKKVVLKI